MFGITLLLVLGFWIYFGQLSPNPILPEKCTHGTDPIYCSGWYVTEDFIRLEFENWADKEIIIEEISFWEKSPNPIYVCKANIEEIHVQNNETVLVTADACTFQNIREFQSEPYVSLYVDYVYRYADSETRNKVRGELLAKIGKDRIK